MQNSATPDDKTIYLKDYTPHAFSIHDIYLTFDLHPTATKVIATSQVTKRRDNEDFILDGHSMILESVAMNDTILTPDQYRLTDHSLIIQHGLCPENFTLTVQTIINPQENTSLEGLYRSGSMYCTQCESQGFRKITYFIDRPDNMACFTVKMLTESDDTTPILLANGNKIQTGTTSEGRAYAVWQDPFKKPSYLFALVAGNLACVTDSFHTMSGRSVALEIYTEHGNETKCNYAMDSLKRSMKWDEEKYGREYDLDLFMIVAVSDFNFGAMENKGLNIFNAKYILADQNTATDTDYEHIEGVVAHEYFHNWTGNRITCRDWFQLCLKEGFTVYRDQSFSGDMRSHVTKRIDDVLTLRTGQFSEDAGGLAHAVRPESYIEINNFYTATVYEKGAELCRMLALFLGEKNFRKATDLYFDRFDGMAVTIEDFLSVMQEASGKDLSQFLYWYRQAGTPHITYTESYDAGKQTYQLELSQIIKPTLNQPDKKPVPMPALTALFAHDGTALNTTYAGNNTHEHVLDFHMQKQIFTFENVSQQPILSLFRGFSAPVIITNILDNQTLLKKMRYDTDLFNRYEAGQKIAEYLILELYHGTSWQELHSMIDGYVLALKEILTDNGYDGLYRAYCFSLPSISYLMQSLQGVVPSRLYDVRLKLRTYIAQQLEKDFLNIYKQTLHRAGFSPAPHHAERRRLHNLCLDFLVLANTQTYAVQAKEHFETADNMTDKMGALSAMLETGHDFYTSMMQDFYTDYQNDALVIDKWFAMQARSVAPNVLDSVKKLITHPDFTYKNPNRVRSLIGVFAHGNPVRFHDVHAYAFIAEQILLLDKINPKTASRMATAFESIEQLETELQQAAEVILKKIQTTQGLSNDVFEITSKIIQSKQG